MNRVSPLRFRPRLEALEERCTPSAASIADFIAAQGTTSIWNYGVAGLPDTPGWSGSTADIKAGNLNFARVDYAGKQAAWLSANVPGFTNPTTTSGSLSERKLSDGRAEVTVNLKAHNAIAWVININFSPNQMEAPPAADRFFGATPDQIVTGAKPALADSQFQVVYTAPAPGAPPPDFVTLWNFGTPAGYSVVSLSFSATAQGTTPTGQQATLVVRETFLGGKTPTPIVVPPVYQDVGWTAAQACEIQAHGNAAPPAAGPSALTATASPSAKASHNASDAAFAGSLDDPLSWSP